MSGFVRTIGLVALLAISLGHAFAEPSRKTATIGEVWLSDPATAKPFSAAFRDGLAKLGYVEGSNLTIAARYAKGDAAKIPALLRELIAQPVDILFVDYSAVRIAMNLTKTVPIVALMGNAAESGLVPSLSHPGGNLTGLSVQWGETDGKRLELAREIMPGLKHLALVDDGNYPEAAHYSALFEAMARGVGVTVHHFAVRNLDEIHGALKAIDLLRPDALYLVVTPLIHLHRGIILQFADAHRMPVITAAAGLAKEGALFTYGENGLDMYRRSATYVDKIIKGAKPGDLPIEQPSKFDLVVNLKTANALGIELPQALLLRADEVIR